MPSTVRLFGAIAVRPAVLPLLPQFEAATGITVVPRWNLNPVVKKEIDAGQAFDLAIINTTMVEDLVRSGKVTAGTQWTFGRVAMGIAAKTAGALGDTKTVEDLRAVLTRAGSIAYASEGTSGGYFVGLLERLGIGGIVAPKLVAVAGGGTAEAVARGDAELGVIPVTSILAAAPSIVLLSRFPEALQSYVDFSMGISARAADEEGAMRLRDFLTSACIDDALASSGVERLSTSTEPQ